MPGLVMPCSRRMRRITRWAFLTAGCRPTQRRSSGSPSKPPRRSTRYSRPGSLAWPRCGVSSTDSPRPSSIGYVVASRRTHIPTRSTSCAAASRWCSRKRPSITVTRYATSPCSRPVPEPGEGAPAEQERLRRGQLAQRQAAGHVELDLAIGGDMGPEQWGQAAPVRVGQGGRPLLVSEHVLDYEGVDVDQGGLQDPQAQHRQFLLVAAVGGDVAALAEEDDAVGPVPRLDHVQALVDFALQVPVA